MATRVALLTNFIPPYRRPLYEQIARRVGELRVFASVRSESNRQWRPDWGGLEVTVQRTLSLRRTWRHPQGFEDVAYVHFPYDTLWQLLRYRPAVVLSAELGLRSLQAALYRRLAPRSRLVLWATLSEHSERGRGRLRTTLRRRLLRQADGVIVNGESGRRYVRGFGVEDRRIVTAPYTFAVEQYLDVPATRAADCAHRLLYVGQLVPRKGVDLLLGALARWGAAHPGEHAELIVAGDGEQRAALEALALPPNVAVSFLGNQDYARLKAVYAGAGILVFPTLADEWGLVVNEAMAAGLPVIGSLYGQSVEELVTDGETGWTFRPDRPDEFDAALGRALATPPAELDRMRAAARPRAARLTPEFVAGRICECIDRVMADATGLADD
jgi:hypothetical protein